MVNLQVTLLVALCLGALYIFILMIRKMIPEKRHKYTGGLDSQGRYDGVGKLVALNGDVYQGEFKAGTFHGKGTYIFKKGGGSYIGEFRNGLFAGHGAESYPDGSKYVGSFDNSKRSGQGTMTYGNGAIFNGAWKAGKKEGFGLMKYSDGTRFDGRFVDGKREGIGFIFDKKNRKLQGKWKGGKLVGGKLTRVLHKTGTPDPTQNPSVAGMLDTTSDETGMGDEDEMDYSSNGVTGAAGAGSGSGGGSSSRVIGASPNRLRQRSNNHGTPNSLTIGGSSSTHSTPSSHSSHSSSSSSRKPLSSHKEKELTNQLLNFSKKQLSLSGGQSSFGSLSAEYVGGMSAQDRERSKLIAELARSHGSSSRNHHHPGGRDRHDSFSGGAATTSTSSSSSQSVAQSTAASPLHTPSRSGRNGTGNGRDDDHHQYEPSLEDVQSSSGLDSESLGQGGIGDDSGEDSSASRGGGVQAMNDPTHVSNVNSTAPTPTLHTRSHISSPISTINTSKVHPSSGMKIKSPTRRDYISSGSEKENERTQ